MVTVSKVKFLERLDVLPESIRDAAFSIEVGAVLRSIAESHHLDPTRIDKLIGLAAAVFFGFLHRTDFAKELEVSATLDMKIAQSITDQVAKKVFSRVSEADLDRIYRPILAGEAEERSIEERSPSKASESPILSFSATHAAGAASKTPASTVAPAPIKPGNAPFVLHEEKSLAAEAKKESMKGFSLPFGLFKSKVSEVTPVPRVTVEAPKKTPEPPKTVHYSEYRSNVAPGSGGEFINLETFGKTSVAPQPIPSPAPAKPTPSVPTNAVPVVPSKTEGSDIIPIKKPEVSPQPKTPTAGTGTPKVEGNMVDLR